MTNPGTVSLRRIGAAVTVLGVAHAVQASVAGHPPGPFAVVVVGAGVVVAATALAADRMPRWAWWSARAFSALVGLELLGSVADRFGLLGSPGEAGVSWGAWQEFVDYTAQLLPWSGMPELFATAATVAEAGLGVLLIAGVLPRLVHGATAALLVVFGLAMVTTVGANEVGRYAVLAQLGAVLIAGFRGRRPGGARSKQGPTSPRATRESARRAGERPLPRSSRRPGQRQAQCQSVATAALKVADGRMTAVVSASSTL